MKQDWQWAYVIIACHLFTLMCCLSPINKTSFREENLIITIVKIIIEMWFWNSIQLDILDKNPLSVLLSYSSLNIMIIALWDLSPPLLVAINFSFSIFTLQFHKLNEMNSACSWNLVFFAFAYVEASFKYFSLRLFLSWPQRNTADLPA